MMMFRHRDDPVLTGRSRMDTDLLSAIMHFDLVIATADPN